MGDGCTIPDHVNCMRAYFIYLDFRLIIRKKLVIVSLKHQLKAKTMKIAKILLVIGLLATGGIIVYGFIVGDILAEGFVLLSMPWGLVTLVDLYTGFFLFSGWILYREKSMGRAAIWIITLMIMGFFLGCVYALIALQKSEGNWRRFWLGDRWQDA